MIKNSKFVTVSLHKATANKASAFYCWSLIHITAFAHLMSTPFIILPRNFLPRWNFASVEFVKEWAVVPAEYVNVDSQYLAWILSSGWLSSSKSRCYETHWNCAVGLAAMLPSISHVYQLLTWTRLGKIRQSTGSLKMICWKLKQI